MATHQTQALDLNGAELIARFLEALFDPEQFGCDWAHFLMLFPSKPRNLVQLSWELYQLFRRFLDRPITHPLDPVHSVPASTKPAMPRSTFRTGVRRTPER